MKYYKLSADFRIFNYLTLKLHKYDRTKYITSFNPENSILLINSTQPIDLFPMNNPYGNITLCLITEEYEY
jgi:hypothetical protein